MRRVQSWFRDWTAAPVLYVDLPVVGPTEVHDKSTILAGIEQWLQVVAGHTIPVVLLDTADKSRGRRLLKRSSSDKVGILALEEVARIDRFAHDLGVKVFWAGGLSLADSYELGKLQVFGIYVTTSISASRPLTENGRHDPMLASQKQPTFEGVSTVKILLESGFLVTRSATRGRSTRLGHSADEAGSCCRPRDGSVDLRPGTIPKLHVTPTWRAQLRPAAQHTRRHLASPSATRYGTRDEIEISRLPQAPPAPQPADGTPVRHAAIASRSPSTPSRVGHADRDPGPRSRTLPSSGVRARRRRAPTRRTRLSQLRGPNDVDHVVDQEARGNGRDKS